MTSLAYRLCNHDGGSDALRNRNSTLRSTFETIIAIKVLHKVKKWKSGKLTKAWSKQTKIANSTKSPRKYGGYMLDARWLRLRMSASAVNIPESLFFLEHNIESLFECLSDMIFFEDSCVVRIKMIIFVERFSGNREKFIIFSFSYPFLERLCLPFEPQRTEQVFHLLHVVQPESYNIIFPIYRHKISLYKPAIFSRISKFSSGSCA